MSKNYDLISEFVTNDAIKDFNNSIATLKVKQEILYSKCVQERKEVIDIYTDKIKNILSLNIPYKISISTESLKFDLEKDNGYTNNINFYKIKRWRDGKSVEEYELNYFSDTINLTEDNGEMCNYIKFLNTLIEKKNLLISIFNLAVSKMETIPSASLYSNICDSINEFASKRNKEIENIISYNLVELEKSREAIPIALSLELKNKFSSIEPPILEVQTGIDLPISKNEWYYNVSKFQILSVGKATSKVEITQYKQNSDDSIYYKVDTVNIKNNILSVLLVEINNWNLFEAKAKSRKQSEKYEERKKDWALNNEILNS